MVSFLFNILITLVSLVLCCLLSLASLPGTELLGVTPYWLLIWLITWSLPRSIWHGAIAGVAVGWIYDGLSVGNTSHVFSLVIVGVLTASLNRDRYLEDDVASIALIVFIMTAIAQTIFAVQSSLLTINLGGGLWVQAWRDYLRIIMTSALITSLWSPAIYLPLNFWWHKALKLND